MEQEQENKAKLDEVEQLKKDYLATFNSETGKKVLAHLEKICFINRTTYSAEGKTLLNEGMRYVIVHIKNMMNFDIELLKKLAGKEEQ